MSFSADCNTIFLGGKFTNVHGVAVNNFAAVNSTTGAVITTIPHSVSGQVESLFRTAGNHLLIGGYFTAGHGSNKPYLFSVNPATGRDDNYVNLAISGNYNYVDDGGRHSASNATHSTTWRSAPTAPSCWSWATSPP